MHSTSRPAICWPTPPTSCQATNRQPPPEELSAMTRTSTTLRRAPSSGCTHPWSTPPRISSPARWIRWSEVQVSDPATPWTNDGKTLASGSGGLQLQDSSHTVRWPLPEQASTHPYAAQAAVSRTRLKTWLPRGKALRAGPCRVRDGRVLPISTGRVYVVSPTVFDCR
jgi:hypothetical protein